MTTPVSDIMIVVTAIIITAAAKTMITVKPYSTTVTVVAAIAINFYRYCYCWCH